MRRVQALVNGKRLPEPDLSSLGGMLGTPENLVWLDLVDPEPEDADRLQELFGFHPLPVEDAMQAHERAKIEKHPEYYFIIFYAARYEPQRHHLDLQPLHVFAGTNFLVTIHPKPSAHVDDTMRWWESDRTAPGVQRVGELVYALLDDIIDDHFPILDALSEQIERLEDAVFRDEEEPSIRTIFLLKKRLLRLRRSLAPGRDVLNVLLRREHTIFGPEDTPYFQDLYDHVVRIVENIDLYHDLLSGALDSYLSSQSNRLNQIVKVLTVASIILMANALVAGIYGMNFQVMPELTWRYGYPFALGLMVAITVSLFAYFRHKRWL